MPHWLIKSAVQRAISLLPKSHVWNEFFQARIARSLGTSTGEIEAKLAKFCRRYYRSLATTRGSPPSEFDVVEIGTGWYPIVPVGLFLCGTRNIWTFDIAPLLRAERLHAMLGCFAELAADGRLNKALPELRPDRLKQLLELRHLAKDEPPEQWLARLHIHVAVRDARDTRLPDRCADLVFSWGVLEHIPEPVLRELVREFKRLLRPDGAMTHYIFTGDQYTYFDRSISYFNYLRFTDKQWRWLDSPIIPQNRLRIGDFRRIFTEGGFEILSEDNDLGSKEALSRVPLAPQFRHYSEEDLLTVFSFMVARPSRS